MPSPLAASAALLLVLAACRPAAVPAPAPAATPAPATPAPATSPAPHASAPRDTVPRRPYAPADAAFMQGMIAHHAQALEMTALIADRTARPALRLLGERITVSQQDEIAMMRRWLQERGEPLPMPGQAMHHEGMAHDGTGHETMPGMATPAELAQLATLRGAAFDRRFLELMIRHHEGALTMVRTLLATPGAAQEPEAYRFATDVDADQRAEIARMRALLATL